MCHVCLSEKCAEAKETVMFCQQLSTVVIETIRVCVTDWEREKTLGAMPKVLYLYLIGKRGKRKNV